MMRWQWQRYYEVHAELPFLIYPQNHSRARRQALEDLFVAVLLLLLLLLLLLHMMNMI